MNENDKLLAEFVGFWITEDADEKHQFFTFHEPLCECKSVKAEDLCVCRDLCSDGPPDFLHDEAASAMLLEKMENPVLVRLFDGGGWMCDADQNSPLDTEYRATDRDRKAAIYAAALKLAKEG